VIDQPAPEAFAGAARVPTRSTAATSKMDLFIANPSPRPQALTLAPPPLHRELVPRQSVGNSADFKVGFGRADDAAVDVDGLEPGQHLVGPFGAPAGAWQLRL
jgi:hypothetical protein